MIAPAPDEVHRIVYLGTPELAVAPLVALHEAGFDIALVVSQPDRRRGRGGDLVPSPVKRAALGLGIPVSDRVDDVLEVDADLGVVVAFGRLIRPHVLEQLPMVNVHFSLLPRWRGAAPVERALLAGDTVTGVCLMVLDIELDVGAVYRRAEVPIGPHDTADDLRGALVEAGTTLLLDGLRDGLGEPEPQVGEPVWAPKIDPAELEIVWTSSAVAIDRLVRLGGAWTSVDGRRLKVWRTRVGADRGLAPGALDGVSVGTGDGTLELAEVQVEGKPRRSAEEWARGARLTADSRLGT